MLKSNGLEIDIEPLQLIYDLKLSLEQNGIYLLGAIKPTYDNIMFSCPSHKDGQERKPSCGMLINDSRKDGRVIEAGTVHCFTCGYTATLSEFVSFCFGYKDAGIFGNKWLKANYTTLLQQASRNVNLNITRKVVKKELPTIEEEILDRYAYTHPYILNRGISEHVIELFDIGYDDMNNSITFPVSNLRGQVKWIQTRAIDYKFYYIPSGVVKTDFLFGAYQCIKYNNGYAPLWIVESPINAMTLWTHGEFAIALFGTGGGNQYKLINQLPYRHVILALDNDEAGNKGMDRLSMYLKNKLISRVEYKDTTKDINDLGIESLKLYRYPVNY